MKRHQSYPMYGFTSKFFYLDAPLFGLLLLLIAFGLVILYSASNQNIDLLWRQGARLIAAIGIMLVFACVPPHKYKLITPWLYLIGLVLLVAVMLIGKIGKGAQRWLDLGVFKFQPSEIMKLAVPMMTAWYIDRRPLPINLTSFATASILILIPAAIIAKQPDLGTAIMVAASGLCVIFIAGIQLRIIALLGLSVAAIAPL